MKTAVILALAMSTSLAAFSVAEAQNARVRVRGTIVSMDGSVLTVKTREGETDRITLKAGWTVSGVTNAALADIKTGDYVGVASIPKTEGGDGALEVLIFPAAMKGTGEGISSYDLKPNSSMTNGTVSNAVKSVNGQEIVITAKGQEKKMSVPAGTPIVTLVAATPADLTAGAGVIVQAEKEADGSLSASRVSVGLKGVMPPM